MYVGIKYEQNGSPSKMYDNPITMKKLFFFRKNKVLTNKHGYLHDQQDDESISQANKWIQPIKVEICPRNSEYGMSSFPLTNSIIFQDVFLTTNQSLKPTIQPSFNQQPAIDPPKKEAVLAV